MSARYNIHAGRSRETRAADLASLLAWAARSEPYTHEHPLAVMRSLARLPEAPGSTYTSPAVAFITEARHV